MKRLNIDRAPLQRHNAPSFVSARGELAQWLEQRNHNPLVPSSSLGFATKNINQNKELAAQSANFFVCSSLYTHCTPIVLFEWRL